MERRNGNELDNLDDDTTGLDTLGLYLHDIGRTPLLNAIEEVELAKNIEAGLYAGKILEVGTDDLTEQESEELRTLAEVGEASKQHFVSANLRLVVSIAGKYTASKMPMLDIIQHGNEGVIHAVEKFDYTKGYKFSTYGTWWVRQAITRGISNENEVIRKPVHVNELLQKMRNTKNQLTAKGIEFNNETLAKAMDVSVERVQELTEWARPTASLDQSIDNGGGNRFNGGSTLLDFVEVVDGQDDYEQINAESEYDDLHKLILSLNMKDRRTAEIIMSRKGVFGRQEMSLRDLGNRYGISPERVRQIERKGMQKLMERAPGVLKRDESA